MAITKLSEFYAEMKHLRQVRFDVVNTIASGKKLNKTQLFQLIEIEEKLRSIPEKDNFFQLKTAQNESIALELDYELGELQKDSIFLKQGESALLNYLSEKHKYFESEIKKGLQFLENKYFDHFVTDRDGTVSNYCGRYQSSVQSIYNALFLSHFTKTVKGKSIIITSAPLFNIGLADISVQPKTDFILSGSKGRELIDDYDKKHFFPIDENQKKKLNQLNSKIEDLLEQNEFSAFRYIGSGLQYKFGQTTLARQDKNNSISAEKSLQLKSQIEKIIQKLDPNQETFRLEDTGKDLEIMLTVNEKNQDLLVDFDKGHGLEFICKTLNINIENQKILICGDTFSDLPLLTKAKAMGANVSSIFVTQDEKLMKEAKSLCNDSFIVSSPDVLVALLKKQSELK